MPLLRSVVIAFSFAVLIFQSAHLQAEPSYITFPANVDWVTRSSDHFTALYRRGQDQLGERALRAAENAHRLLSPSFPPGPDRTFLVLADFQDSTNGYALNFPYSHIVVFVAPPESTGSLASLDDWLDSVILHEYVHILHIYPARGLWKPMRTIFGSWVIPNGLMPTHFHEGMATFFETELTRGGRGRGNYFGMIKRMAVEEKAWGKDAFYPLDRLEGSPVLWPHGTTQYFFGYTLTKELWARKGAKGIYQLTDSYSSNWPYFLSTPLNEVYQTNYSDLWDDIFKKTTAEELKEIAQIKQKGLSPLAYRTQTKFSKWDLVSSPDRKQIAYRSTTPGETLGLEIRNLESMELMDRIEVDPSRAEGICWGLNNKKDTIFFIDSQSESNYGTKRLFSYDLATKKQSGPITVSRNGKSEKIEHIHQIGCSDDLKRILYYSETAGNGLLVEASLEATKDESNLNFREERHWKLPAGAWITALSRNPTSIIAMRRGVETSIMQWTSGDPQSLFHTPQILANFRQSGNDSLLYAVGSGDGRDELWGIDVKKKELKKQVSVLGGINSFAFTDRGWALVSYRHGGWDIAVTPKPDGKSSKAEKLSFSPTRKMTSEESPKMGPVEDYSAWGTLLPRTWVPTLLFVPNGAQVGAWIPGFDLSQKHFYNIVGGYDTRGLPFAEVAYNYRAAQKLSVDTAVFYLPSYLISSKTFLKRWGANLGFSSGILGTPQNVRIGLAYRKLEANGASNQNQSIGVGVDLSHKFWYKRRPLDVAPYRGTKLYLSHYQYFKALGSTDNYFTTVGGIDQYFEAPWKQGHIFLLAGRMGYTEGTIFVNSYFESGGELIFAETRGSYLNRGFLPGTFFGRRLFNANLEYRFPLFRVDHGINLLPAYLKHVHAAIVGDVTTFDFGALARFRKDLFRVYYASVGAEIKSEWNFMFYLPTQIRLGAYHGFGPVGEPFYFTIGFETAI